jgi:fengycin family lipopeptide synthetase D
MIDHRALLDRCRWFVERFALTTADRGTKYGDLTTSASPFELLPFLAVGAAISILPERVGYDRELLTRRLAEEGATLSWLPAPLCEHLASEELPALRALITSGRTVSPERRGSYELVCCYGSAECTEILACTAVGSGGGSVVGRPVPRTAAYVLAHDGGLQPVGVAGELWVAGAGLARGYLDDAAATARRFTTNPHARGARMVRTGDTARWLPDGRLEITGRPGQVNIDGHRACLAEIERSLLSHPDVSEAVVLFDDLDPRDERLIAYLVLRQGLPVSADAFVQALRSHLAAWLPPYLIPDTYIKVGMIPREADGRVEHERLPMPERDAAASDRSRTTRRVTSIVEELLDQPVGADADLFELGMSSLTTMELLARLNGTLGFSPTVEQMLSQPTISGVSDWLSQALHSSCRTVAPPEQESRLP